MTPEERKAEWERVPSQAEIDQAIEGARRPALLLNKTKFRDGPGEPGCWLHGQPTLPPEIEWPHQEVNGVPWPLFFVAQVNLARVPRLPDFPKVPDLGTLFFFYDPLLSTTDAKIIYVSEEASNYPPRKMPDPEYRPIDEWTDEDVFEVIEENLLPKWSFDFLEITVFDEHTLNRAMNHRICAEGLAAYRMAENQTSDRWSSGEPGSLKKMSFSYLFGCQPNAFYPEGKPVLLFVLDGAIVYNFWIPGEALAARDFDEAFMTIAE